MLCKLDFSRSEYANKHFRLKNISCVAKKKNIYILLNAYYIIVMIVTLLILNSNLPRDCLHCFSFCPLSDSVCIIFYVCILCPSARKRRIMK